MTIDWQQVLSTIGSTAVIVGAAAFLTKSLINQFLTRDIEKFKARLKADADMEIEKLKNSLQMVALEHQVRFSRLHEKRAEVIADLYARLVDAEREGDHFVKVASWDDEKGRESFRTTNQNLLDLYYFVEKNGIYLPDSVCDLLTNFVLTIRSKAIGMHYYARVESGMPNQTFIEERVKVIKEAYESFQYQIPAARKALQSEFRTILGG
jgi:hypothetical protein